MDSLDKIIMQEANTVTSDEYKRLTGTSLEESMARMKEHMAEMKAKVAKEKAAKQQTRTIIPMDMGYAMPMAAALPRKKRKK